MEIIKVDWLNKLLSQVQEGEVEATTAYKKMKDFEKQMKKVYKQIEELAVDEVSENKGEYPEFTISERKTYNYKENEEYLEKYKELKELEKDIKTATDIAEKSSSYVDKDWVVIDPVSVKYSRIFTYRPKK